MVLCTHESYLPQPAWFCQWSEHLIKREEGGKAFPHSRMGIKNSLLLSLWVHTETSIPKSNRIFFLDLLKIVAIFPFFTLKKGRKERERRKFL